MKPKFPIFLAAALLLGTASAEAAHQKAARNNPIPTTPHTNPSGGIGTGQSFPPISSAPLTPPNPIEDAPTLNTQTFGGLPGAPTYNPFAALPPLNNPAAPAPLPGPTPSGGPPGQTTSP